MLTWKDRPRFILPKCKPLGIEGIENTGCPSVSRQWKERYFWRVIQVLGGGCSECLPLSPSAGAMWVHLGASPFLPGESQLNL